MAKKTQSIGLRIVQSVDTYLRTLRSANAYQVFSTFPRVEEQDKILVFFLGGGGGMPKVARALQRRFPQSLSKLMFFAVDFDIDPEHVDKNTWGYFDIGEELKDLSLKEVVERHGIPAGLFTTAEQKSLQSFIDSNGNHLFADGAGANPLVGKLGMKLAEDEYLAWLYDIIESIHSNPANKHVKVIVIKGVGGGTGEGIADQAIPALKAAFERAMINASVITVNLAFHAYDRIVFAGSQGVVTKMAPLLWERSKKAWKKARNTFFLVSPVGPDGLLGTIMLVLEKASVLNNAHENEAYQNALIQVSEITPEAIQRIAAFEIERGRVAPSLAEKNYWNAFTPFLSFSRKIELTLDVSSLVTIEEFAHASHFLKEANWRAALAMELNRRGWEPESIENYANIEALVQTQIEALNGIVMDLRRRSYATGAYVLPQEEELIEKIMPASLDDVQRGTYTIATSPSILKPMVPGQLMAGDNFQFGSAAMLWEIGGKAGTESDGSDALLIPEFKSVSAEEAAQARRNQGIQDIKARAKKRAA